MHHNDSITPQDPALAAWGVIEGPVGPDGRLTTEKTTTSHVERFILMRVTMPDTGMDGRDPEEVVTELIKKIETRDESSPATFTAEQVYPEYDGDNADDFIESNFGNFNINGFGRKS